MAKKTSYLQRSKFIKPSFDTKEIIGLEGSRTKRGRSEGNHSKWTSREKSKWCLCFCCCNSKLCVQCWLIKGNFIRRSFSSKK
ncbi:unnamed protein product, partial [Vitis vinifera]|uniref:Uncharacterized protein n=1 Tax=Vitis vinifera TaxID=29760 RepID=D7TS76_VITVI